MDHTSYIEHNINTLTSIQTEIVAKDLIITDKETPYALVLKEIMKRLIRTCICINKYHM
jgi:hypothetical protein